MARIWRADLSGAIKVLRNERRQQSDSFLWQMGFGAASAGGDGAQQLESGGATT